MQSRSLGRDTTSFATAISILFCAAVALAQSTGFTYQGRLTDGGTAANGNYDLQFALFDSSSSGAQVGSTQTLNTVAVSNGVFTVSLDFGANAFPGASRFLEISARPSGTGSFTLLTPRQPITSTPYAVRSLNAATADSVLPSGVPAGSGNYIQNSSSPQAANFNISGSGTAAGTLSSNVVDAATQYNLNGFRILSNAGANNLFAGVGAGQSNTGRQNSFFGAAAGGQGTTGSFNSFFGYSAGNANTSGGQNAFFGSQAGDQNTTGGFNSFFGHSAGNRNTSGNQNSFFGERAGDQNTTGNSNSFFGQGSGTSNTTGFANSFFGSGSGPLNLTGSFNSFFGRSAGRSITSGIHNTFIGADAGNLQGTSNGDNNTVIGDSANVLVGDFGGGVVSNATALGADALVLGNNATAVGFKAQADAPNSLVLGSIFGVNGCFPSSSCNSVNVGIGTTAPNKLLHLKGLGSDFAGAGDLLVTGTGTVGSAITLEASGSGGRKYSWISTASAADPGGGALAALDVTNTIYRMVINSAGRVGIGTTAPDQMLSVNGNASKASGGTSWAVFSDERLKDTKGRFTPGLKALLQLQPIRFEYKPDNSLGLPSGGEEVGFSAQAVEKVLPEAVSRTQQGYLQLHSDPIMLTMLNAIKEQQAQIQQQRQLIEQQQQQLNALKKLACRSQRRARVCK